MGYIIFKLKKRILNIVQSIPSREAKAVLDQYEYRRYKNIAALLLTLDKIHDQVEASGLSDEELVELSLGDN